MIETEGDQLGGLCTLIAGREKRAWQHLVRHLQLEDTFGAKPGHLRFSWDNRRCFRHSPNLRISSDGHRTLRRLDRVYCFCQERNPKFNLTSTILPGFALSDHAPVLSTFTFQVTCRRSSQHRMNSSHQSDPAYQERLHTIWTDTEIRGLAGGLSEDSILFQCLRKARRLDRAWGKQKARERRSCRRLLQDRVGRAQLQLETDPLDQLVQEELRDALDELTRLEEDKAKWVEFVLQSRWIKGGEKCSKTFFQSFKGLAVDSEIHEIFNHQGLLQQSWDGISEAATSFFSGILGETLSPSQEHLHLILDRQVRRISDAQRSMLNADFSMEEIHKAAVSLSKGKCPGPDGIPVEFFTENWALVGPTLFRAISTALSSGVLHRRFTCGFIVLLKKKGDQRFLSNKRPITLLNVIYKIAAKAFQLRLIPILQDFITTQQSAFLPGRNIHHSILFTNELLHQAEQSGENFILLKLDIIKAFDKIEWTFLLALLNRLGFNGMLTSFLEATYGSAASAVLINGRMSPSFLLARSVRQGCPLSPLLFIIAIDALSHVLMEETNSGWIEGVRIPEMDIHSAHSLFADDLTMILRADMTFIQNCKDTLDSFGHASGLFVDWSKTNAALIPSRPVPADFLELGWKWETSSSATKLLGIHMAQLISEEKMTEFVTSRLEQEIIRWRKHTTTLMGRIAIVNHLILSQLWYTLTVWTGKMSTLENLQRMIVKFIWRGQNPAGRARVNINTLTKPRNMGGLGLISIPHQVRALAGGFFTWAIKAGDHPLRRLLQHRIRELSVKRWGSYDFTWIYAPCNTMPVDGSPLWGNLCRAWNTLKRQLTPWHQATVEDWRSLPLWQIHTNHNGNSMQEITRATQRSLTHAGFCTMNDVTNRDGLMMAWDSGPHQLLSVRLRPAYERLLGGLHHQPVLCPDRHMESIVHMEALVPDRGTFIWEFCLPRMQVVNHWYTNGALYPPKRVFALSHQSLIPVPFFPLPDQCEPSRVLVRIIDQQGTTKRTRIGRPLADLRFALQYRWRDKIEFFNTCTSHLRSIQLREERQPHRRICQWQELFRLDLHLPTLWKETWLPFRSMSENCFLWQLLYRIPATQHWRFPQLPAADQRTWCTRCNSQVMEDILHCIWYCPISREVWKWVNYIISISANQSTQYPLIHPAHIFVAKAFQRNFGIPEKLWQILRAASAWIIWKERCKHFIEGSPSTSASGINMIWSRVRTYIRQAWLDNLRRIRLGQLSQTEAIAHMSRSFGNSSEVWSIHEDKLQIPPVPPRPP